MSIAESSDTCLGERTLASQKVRLAGLLAVAHICSPDALGRDVVNFEEGDYHGDQAKW
jgi:hypothetical protein